MHEKNKYRHIPWNRYNLEKYRDTDFWSYRPALTQGVYLMHNSNSISDDSICAIHLYSSRWHCVLCLLIITAGINQKNIISKNWTEWLEFLNCRAITVRNEICAKCHCHLMVDVVNKLSAIKILISRSLKTLVLRIWLRSRIWTRCWMYCGSALWR